MLLSLSAVFSSTPKAEVPALFNSQQQPTHSVHSADAKQVKVAVNKLFFHPIESSFAATPFVDFLVEARKLERLNDRGTSLKSRISLFLFPESPSGPPAHSTLQRCPLAHMNTCQFSLCDEIIEPRSMHMHIEFTRGENFHLSLYYSELQLRIAGILGIRLNSQGEGGNEVVRCPFLHCTQAFRTLARVPHHVFSHHKSHEQEFYRHMGGDFLFHQ
jgi:hypothetical protein